ncbi:MAG: FAD-dependent oxidoreductase, partial [Oscillochloris sp.]|nr:FAD-dependent oxidoreductase [Oscillochloris sp.]
MKIVILGAGYAGLRAAINLEKRLRAQRMDDSITLVDKNSYHQMLQELHLTATNGIDSQATIYDLNRVLARRNIDFVQGRINSISPSEHEVQLSDGSRLPYDRLVIALGGETDFHNVPGAREYSLPLHTFNDAIAIRDHIIAQFSTAARLSDPKEQRIVLTTAIIGGGYTGCQLAGELSAWVLDLCKGSPKEYIVNNLLLRTMQQARYSPDNVGHFGLAATDYTHFTSP